MTVLNSHSFFLLVSILFLGATFSKQDECSLQVFDEGSEEPIEGFCVEQFSSKECRPFVASFQRSDLPEGFALSVDDDSVQKPESLDLTGKLTPWVDQDNKENLIPGMYVDWRSPIASLSRKSVKGYLLIWKEGTSVSCRLFKLNSTDKALLQKKLRYRFEIAYMKPNTHYEGLVYSMPPPETLEDSENESTFVSKKLTTSSRISNSAADMDPGDWTPSLSAHMSSPGTVTVKVGHSPKQFNLTKFNVKLVKRSRDELNYFKRTDYTGPADSKFGIVTFDNLESDEYKVVVLVEDTFPGERDKCLCWKEETGGRRHCKLSCGNVGTDWFNVSGDARLPDETTSYPKDSPPQDSNSGVAAVTCRPISNVDGVVQPIAKLSSKDSSSEKTALIIGPVVGAVALVAVAVGVFVVLRQRQVKAKGSGCDAERPKPPPTEGPAQLKIQTIYIVCAEDKNQAPSDFVAKLAKLLKAYQY